MASGGMLGSSALVVLRLNSNELELGWLLGRDVRLPMKSARDLRNTGNSQRTEDVRFVDCGVLLLSPEVRLLTAKATMLGLRSSRRIGAAPRVYTVFASEAAVLACGSPPGQGRNAAEWDVRSQKAAPSSR